MADRAFLDHGFANPRARALMRPSWEIHSDAARESPPSRPILDPGPQSADGPADGTIGLRLTKALVDDPINTARLAVISVLLMLACFFAVLKPVPATSHVDVDACPNCQDAVPLGDTLQPIKQKAASPIAANESNSR